MAVLPQRPRVRDIGLEDLPSKAHAEPVGLQPCPRTQRQPENRRRQRYCALRDFSKHPSDFPRTFSEDLSKTFLQGPSTSIFSKPLRLVPCGAPASAPPDM